VFFDDGNNFIFDELARGLAHQFFFVVELRIKIDEVHAAESSHEMIVAGVGWPVRDGSRSLAMTARWRRFPNWETLVEIRGTPTPRVFAQEYAAH
jgi:hypothetical protein